MSSEITAAPHPLDASPSWAAVWLNALVKPSAATYARLAQQPRATARSAYMWMAIGGLIGGLSSGLGTALFQISQNQALDTGILLAIPLYAVLVVLFWALFAGSAQLAARLFKGTGTHQQLSYSFAAFSAPLTIAFSILSLVPQTGIVQLVLYVYWIILYIQAIRAVNQISLLRAVGSGLIALLVTLVAGGLSYSLVLMPGLW
jgi:hypothetical protein